MGWDNNWIIHTVLHFDNLMYLLLCFWVNCLPLSQAGKIEHLIKGVWGPTTGLTSIHKFSKFSFYCSAKQNYPLKLFQEAPGLCPRRRKRQKLYQTQKPCMNKRSREGFKSPRDLTSLANVSNVSLAAHRIWIWIFGQTKCSAKQHR